MKNLYIKNTKFDIEDDIVKATLTLTTAADREMGDLVFEFPYIQPLDLVDRIIEMYQDGFYDNGEFIPKDSVDARGEQYHICYDRYGADIDTTIHVSVDDVSIEYCGELTHVYIDLVDDWGYSFDSLYAKGMWDDEFDAITSVLDEHQDGVYSLDSESILDDCIIGSDTRVREYHIDYDPWDFMEYLPEDDFDDEEESAGNGGVLQAYLHDLEYDVDGDIINLTANIDIEGVYEQIPIRRTYFYCSFADSVKYLLEEYTDAVYVGEIESIFPITENVDDCEDVRTIHINYSPNDIPDRYNNVSGSGRIQGYRLGSYDFANRGNLQCHIGQVEVWYGSEMHIEIYDDEDCVVGDMYCGDVEDGVRRGIMSTLEYYDSAYYNIYYDCVVSYYDEVYDGYHVDVDINYTEQDIDMDWVISEYGE